MNHPNRLPMCLAAVLLALSLGSSAVAAAEQTFTATIDSVGAGKNGKKNELTAHLTDTASMSPAFTDKAFTLYPGLGKEMLATLLTAVSNNQQVEIVTDLQTPAVLNQNLTPIITKLRLIK